MNCKLNNLGVVQDKKSNVIKNRFKLSEDLSLDVLFLDKGNEDIMLVPTHYKSTGLNIYDKIPTSIAFEAIVRSMCRQLNDNRDKFVKRSKNTKISIYFGGVGEPLYNKELVFAIANLENVFKEIGYEDISFNVVTKLKTEIQTSEWFNQFYYENKKSQNKVKIAKEKDFHIEFDDANASEVYDLQRDDNQDCDETYMNIAKEVAKRSKDPSTQVGACIVGHDNIVISLGYNGALDGWNDSLFPWGKDGKALEKKYLYVMHAERNAISHSAGRDLRGAKIYVDLFPCNECAKEIVQSGIKEVIYLSDKYDYTDEVKASKRIFDSTGIIYRQLVPKSKEITLRLE